MQWIALLADITISDRVLEGLFMFALVQFVAAIGWAVRVEMKLAKLEGQARVAREVAAVSQKTLDALVEGQNRQSVHIATQTVQITTLTERIEDVLDQLKDSNRRSKA